MERARLADRLLFSLSPEIDAHCFEELDSETTTRIKARRNGEIEVGDGNAAVARLWDSPEQ